MRCWQCGNHNLTTGGECLICNDVRRLGVSDWFEPLPLTTKPDGGPAAYYDFPKGALTLNDLIEHKDMGFHRGNIFKACWRWGEKEGTSKPYDARKIIYSGARLLMKVAGVKEVREVLQKMLDDPQFKERD